MMTEREIRTESVMAERAPANRSSMGSGGGAPGVMDRLARMLAESTTPPSPKARIIEDLLRGNFESLEDAAGQRRDA